MYVLLTRATEKRSVQYRQYRVPESTARAVRRWAATSMYSRSRQVTTASSYMNRYRRHLTYLSTRSTPASTKPQAPIWSRVAFFYHEHVVLGHPTARELGGFTYSAFCCEHHGHAFDDGSVQYRSLEAVQVEDRKTTPSCGASISATIQRTCTCVGEPTRNKGRKRLALQDEEILKHLHTVDHAEYLARHKNVAF